MNVFLITGTSSGIGRAMALHFARAGHRVHATMRSPERAGRSLEDAARSEDLDLHVHALDVTDERSIDGAVGRVEVESGRVDVLVNNAGTARLGTVEESPTGWLVETLDTNVVGPVRMIRRVLPGMRERGSGVIVNVSSVSGRLASPAVSHYAASKHALEAVSEALAAEVGPFGVRVIILQPGFVATPMADKALRLPEGSLDGPYADLMTRQREFFRDGIEGGDPPDVVALALERALGDPEPRLRYTAAASARDSLDYRRSVSDEEWVGMTASPD